MMKSIALDEQLLGLKSPCSVKTVDFSLTEQRGVVEVVLRPDQEWADPTDQTKRAPRIKYSDGIAQRIGRAIRQTPQPPSP